MHCQANTQNEMYHLSNQKFNQIKKTIPPSHSQHRNSLITFSPLSPQCNEKTFSNWLVSDILRLLVITIRTYKPSEARIEQFWKPKKLKKSSCISKPNCILHLSLTKYLCLPAFSPFDFVQMWVLAPIFNTFLFLPPEDFILNLW